MTQQRFDLAERPPDALPGAEASSAEARPLAAAPLPIPREPSDLDLRERQMRWVRARLQFEARGKPAEPPEGPK
jgi:hypothetical protein